MERLYSGRLNEWAHTLAFHWSNTQNTCKTVRYLVMAGEKSYWVCALEEAHQRFRKALELIEAVPGCVDDLFLSNVLIKWARVFVYRADFNGLKNLLERYLPRVEALGDKRQLSLILSWLAQSHVYAGRGGIAKPLLERAHALAQETGDPKCIGVAARELVWLYSYWIPDSGLSDAMVERFYRQALECGEAVNDIMILMEATLAVGGHAFRRGRYAEGRRYCSKLVEYGRRFRDNRSLSHAQWRLGFANVYEEQYEEALENAEQALQLSPGQNTELCALAVKGAALALSGKSEEGMEILRNIQNELIKNEFILPLAMVDMPLGIAMVKAGQMSRGVKHIHDCMRYWAVLGNYTQPVWGNAHLGDIYLQLATGGVTLSPRVFLGNLCFLVRTLPVARRKARHHFEEVVRDARTYNMPGLLSQALYSLGLLSQAKKDPGKARSYYEEALKAAEASGLLIAEKIRSALNSLEKSKN
jgi:tetratricopeptide (TPR) repeat protein